MTNQQAKNHSRNTQETIKGVASGGELPQKQVVKSFETKAKKNRTAAFDRVQSHRDRINDGFECWIADDLSNVAYLFEINGKFLARGYRGRAKKSAFYYSFKSEDSRSQFVADWMQKRSESAEAKVKAVEPRALEVGDVLYDSWGWEQTNVTYYKVLELVGSQSVKVIEIGSVRDYDGHAMTGKSWPDPCHEIGEAFVRRVSGGIRIKVNSVIQPKKKSYTVEAGKRVYRYDYFSTYA